MEIRKIQMTGRSSFVLTLPKNWVDSLEIQKNDPLGVIIQSDGNLLITKNISGEKIQRTKNIEVHQKTDPVFFYRMLIGIYIAGYNTIAISSKDRISGKIRECIKEFTNMLIGIEFVEETDNKIILKDLLNPLEMTFANSLKRMFVIAKSMHNKAIESLRTNNIALAAEVVQQDSDVDRLFWLIARQTNMIMQNVHLAQKMNTTIIEIIPHYHVGRIIERVADHAVRISRNVEKVKENQIETNIIDKISIASDKAILVFTQSVGSFFSHDIMNANRIIESIHSLETDYSKINSEILDLPAGLAVLIRNISDSIKRTGEYSADIAENVINYEMMVT